VKISGQNIPETIASIEKKWKVVAPYMPFEYRFLDEDYSKLYRSELQLGAMMNLFAAIAITLACLGLFGLSAFVVKQRVKEISIRKVLGASLTNIVSILSWNFTKLIVLAIVIAIPLAYYAMNQWLQAFSYRIETEWWIFAAAGTLAVTIAWVTVSIESVKAALSNPVENLRSE
jgi:putative ABC transport system permease protein